MSVDDLPSDRIDATAENESAEATEAVSTDTDTVLSIDDVSCVFGSEQAVDELSLTVEEGELLTLLGPSGCGKTTLLRLVAGLERPDAGRISLDGQVVARPDEMTPPEYRDVGLVFQDFALFPHLTAGENVAFGIDDWPAEEREARVSELLALVGLEDQRESAPGELSGGQQQRVALARALAPEPDLLLLDEPFSNLDVDLRVRMREEVRQIIKETGVTAVSVTHDQEEALSISDRVAVVHDGHIEQVGTPETVFQRPTSRFVATFLGHAAFLSGTLHGEEIRTEIDTLARERVHGLDRAYDHATVDILLRPDDLRARPVDSEREADGHVTYRRYLGPSVLYRVTLESGATVECMHNHSDDVKLDEQVAVELTAEHDLAWFPREEHVGEQSSK
jgi:iron(III) transport system ATP-binding protein